METLILISLKMLAISVNFYFLTSLNQSLLGERRRGCERSHGYSPLFWVKIVNILSFFPFKNKMTNYSPEGVQEAALVSVGLRSGSTLESVVLILSSLDVFIFFSSKCCALFVASPSLFSAFLNEQIRIF